MFRMNLSVTGLTGRFLFLSFMLALMVPVLSGCGASEYGRLQNSPEVTRAFKENRILSGHQYYYSGFQRIPYGIIGIDNKYQLRSRQWKPIDLSPTQLNQLTYRMEHVYSLPARGAWIMDQENSRVGIWYSSRYQTRVRIEKDNRIVVVPPEPPDLRGIP